MPLAQPKSLVKTNCWVMLHKTLPIVDISGFGVISALAASDTIIQITSHF